MITVYTYTTERELSSGSSTLCHCYKHMYGQTGWMSGVQCGSLYAVLECNDPGHVVYSVDDSFVHHRLGGDTRVAKCDSPLDTIHHN